MHNERKQVNRNVEQGGNSGTKRTTNNSGTTKPEGPLDWDARDLKTYGWVSKSSRSTEGRYTDRFWEED